MSKNRFIATPIRSQKHVNYMEDVFDEEHTWQRRARKLRSRRWRKLVTRMTLTETSPWRPRHSSY